MNPVRNVLFQEYLAELKRSPEFREAWAKYELAHQIVRLRIERGLTQAQLAERVGTTQSSIARLESGSREPSLSFLRRVVKALGGQVEVNILPEEATGSAAVYAPSRELIQRVAEPQAPYGDAAQDASEDS